MIRALLWKELREQGWRFLLGALVLTSLSASLVRAQLVTIAEATMLVFGPLGLILTIFFAMGSVATERADGTWPFLVARPIRRATVLRVKWLAGAIGLVASFMIAAAAAHWAASSRHLFSLPPVPPEVRAVAPNMVPEGNSAAWLWGIAGLSTVSMLAWYTTLFFLLTRARDELHAGLGGILLTLGAIAWALQYLFSGAAGFYHDWPSVQRVFWVSSLLNPISPLVFSFDSHIAQALALAWALLFWTAGPVWLVGRLESAGRIR